MSLQQLKLFHQQALIAGEWCDADEKTPVINPADLSTLGHVPYLGKAETLKAIDQAAQGWEKWKVTTAEHRSNILKKWHALLITHQDELAYILTAEQGKPLKEAQAEIRYAARFVEWFAEEAKRTYGDVIPSHEQGAQIIVTKQAIGVVAAITPWNFPAAMITRKLAPALAAGCACVLKPAPETPFTALAIADLALQAGVPPDIISVITGDAQAIGEAFFESNLVRKLTFTGSTSVGKILLERSAQTLKKVSLELGGNAPFIVFEDANLDEAVDGALVAKFRNAGQTCVCVNRFYVHAAVYDQFIEKFKIKIEALTVGAGTDHYDIGPVINEQAIGKVQQHIQDALEQGASLVTGGEIHEAGPLFFQPTLIQDVNAQMLVASQETFGPLAAIFKFETEQEVITLANATEYGLAAYCYTQDLGRAWRMSQHLEYGMLGINKGAISTEVAPFGGIKHSGLGREGSKYGIEDYMEIKYTLFGGLGA